ncbi:MAG: hypothetical protein GC202_11880 [Alphaproteobacteria bacterium]|nr:hypothetical protein [Alphaproteobacteria bacterium]
MLSMIRKRLSDWRWERMIQRTRSRLPYVEGQRYVDYLERARRMGGIPQPPQDRIAAAAAAYGSDGYSIFHPSGAPDLAARMRDRVSKLAEAAGETAWQDDRFTAGDVYRDFPEIRELLAGEIGAFYRAAFGAHFKIFYGMIFRSIRRQENAVNSQIWHADGGPGTCIISAIALTDIGAHNGGTEVLPWPRSVELMREERRNSAVLSERKRALGEKATKLQLRSVICDFYGESIERAYKESIVQASGPPGTIFSFSNNLIHRGGHPMPGQERMVALLHVYPSCEPTPFERYARDGIPKTAGMPAGPDF